MTELTKGKTKFTWGEKQQQAFEQLRKLVTSAPVLDVIDSSESAKLEVHTDASAKAIGAVLL